MKVIVELPIIASFNASLDMTVTAGRRRAIVEARIGLILVTIVALLIAIGHPITTEMQLTSTSASIGVIITVMCSVIASFSGILYTITAER